MPDPLAFVTQSDTPKQRARLTVRMPAVEKPYQPNSLPRITYPIKPEGIQTSHIGTTTKTGHDFITMGLFNFSNVLFSFNFPRRLKSLLGSGQVKLLKFFN